MLHVQVIPRKMTMGMSLSHCLGGRSHVYLWHVPQVLDSIYGDGAMHTAAAKVMPIACQNQFELKGEGGAILGGWLNRLETSAFQCIPTCAA